MNPKSEVRKYIAEKKKEYTESELAKESLILTNRLIQLACFKKAQTILLYHSLPDEVSTHQLISSWCNKKEILLPVVHGDELLIKKYSKNLSTGSFGILEPIGPNFINFNKIDLAIIPGVAFDNEGRRLGRGKGYYDRLLPKIKAYKLGICFPFQLIDKVPTDEYDIRMDEILS